MTRVLIVEDDRSLSQAVQYRLKKDGFEVMVCEDGLQGLSEAEDRRYDLLLLDRMLPGITGDELLRKLRAKGWDAKVLMLTAMDGIEDRVVGLDAGADDYLVKPFAMDELMARIRALLRRPSSLVAGNELAVADVTLDANGLSLKCKDHSETLTKREAKLMEFLLLNPNQVLPRNVLFERVWDDAFVEEGNLDIYIHFLRKRLSSLRSGVKIETVRGIGYRLNTGEGRRT